MSKSKNLKHFNIVLKIDSQGDETAKELLLSVLECLNQLDGSVKCLINSETFEDMDYTWNGEKLIVNLPSNELVFV